MTFFNKYDFSFSHIIIYLLINYNVYPKERKFFVDHGIFERLNFLIKTNLDKLEPKYYIYLIRLINILARLFDECENYSNEQKKKLGFTFIIICKKYNQKFFCK